MVAQTSSLWEKIVTLPLVRFYSIRYEKSLRNACWRARYGDVLNDFLTYCTVFHRIFLIESIYIFIHNIN